MKPFNPVTVTAKSLASKVPALLVKVPPTVSTSSSFSVPAPVWLMLEKLGCDQGQGFVFSRPLKAFDVQQLLTTTYSGKSVAAA